MYSEDDSGSAGAQSPLPPPYLVFRPRHQYWEYQLPVSFRAVIPWQGRIPLLRNYRDEWELPGGKLELGEEPVDCLRREVREELAWEVEVGRPCHLWVREVRAYRHVLMAVYRATYAGDAPPRCSAEHQEVQLFTVAEALGGSVKLGQGYRDSIRAALELEGR